MIFIQRLGKWAIDLILGCGRACILLIDILSCLHLIIKRRHLIIRQIYVTGVLSLPIILVAGLFVGMVLGFQGHVTLSQFGAGTALGAMVALSLVRELGPVVSALLFAGRAGSAMTSEIGLMKATEQISGMQMMAVRPTEYVYMPRFVATIISVPLLAVVFTTIAIVGGYLVGVIQLKGDDGAYWGSMQSTVRFYSDVYLGVIIKSFVFGIISAIVSVYQGYNSSDTSEGVGQATTKTVVITSLWILVSDFILTALFFGIN